MTDVKWWWKQKVETLLPLELEELERQRSYFVRPATALQALMETPTGQDPVESHEERTEREESAAWRIREAMLVLSDEEWAVVVMRNHLQLSFDEISAYLDRPKTTVYYQWHRGLEKMKEELGDYE